MQFDETWGESGLESGQQFHEIDDGGVGLGSIVGGKARGQSVGSFDCGAEEGLGLLKRPFAAFFIIRDVPLQSAEDFVSMEGQLDVFEMQ